MTLENIFKNINLKESFPSTILTNYKRELAAGDAICHQGEALTALSYFAKGKLKSFDVYLTAKNTF